MPLLHFTLSQNSCEYPYVMYIPGVVEAIQGVRRVLKPSGKLIFFEHGLSARSSSASLTKAIGPLLRLAFEGCRVTRDIPSLIGKGAALSNRWTQDTFLLF